MATDRFGQPIITRSPTPFADNLRNRYGGGTPMLGNRFNVDFTHPSTTMAGGYSGSSGATRTPRPDAGNYGIDWNQGGRDAGQYTGFHPGTAPTNRVATRPTPLPGTYGDFGAATMHPYTPGPRPGAMPMTPVGGNNLTPRFDPTQDNPWGRSGNLNQGLHGLLAQLLGGGRRF